MGVIKQNYLPVHEEKALKQLTEEFEDALTKDGLTPKQIATILRKVIALVKEKAKGQYVLMGGYAPETQLFDEAIRMIHELDNDGRLEGLLEEKEEAAEIEVAEPDIEDAYNSADAIAFTGSEKKVNWAKNIAINSAEEIARAWKQKDFKLPTSSDWWIDNREDIYSALLKL